MLSRAFFCFSLLCVLLAPALPGAADKPVVRIAVLAHRGAEAARANWQPTADYLSQAIPSHSFVIEPLMNKTLPPAVADQQVEFVLTNPGSYTMLEAAHGVTRILTLRDLREGKPYTQFGGVIFTRADRSDIQTLADLRGKSFMGVHKDAFGGFQLAWRELKRAGVDPFRDFSRLEFAGLPQDSIVYAVRDGKVDAGTVRTDTLEHMAAEGMIELAAFRVLNPQQHAGFPFALSTSLYPEWAFARLRHTPEELAQKVVVALLSLPADSPAVRASRSGGWTVPLDYTPVDELYKELRIGPYENMGQITWRDLVRQHWPWLVAVFGVLALLATVVLYILQLNRRLKQSQRKLIEITHQLETSNRGLQQLSALDGLTGIPNHRSFADTLTKEWARAGRAKTALGLLMIDIDFFKKHNDVYGHQAGDECLKQVAAVLRATVQRPADFVARYGGEEFAVILPGTEMIGAIIVAERIRQAVEAIRLDYGDPLAHHHVTVSVGVASVIPTASTTDVDLVAAADQALYKAKAVGRNQVIAA
jgi:diguanylate cyclase (GGDEF)-like protein